MSSVSWPDVVSLVASVVSIILGGFAIWLSVVFYRFSNESSSRIREASDRISGSVDRLEILFNKLYADTFSMMRETVTDMRKHIWRDDALPVSNVVTEEIEKRADTRINELQQQFQTDLARLLDQQSTTDARLSKLQGDLRSLVNRAIRESRKAEAEAREETIRDRILGAIDQIVGRGEKAKFGDVATELGLGEGDIVSEVFKMAHDGVITWPGAPSSVGSDNELRRVLSSDSTSPRRPTSSRRPTLENT